MKFSDKIKVTSPNDDQVLLPEAQILYGGAQHYPVSDKGIFLAGYNALCGDGLNGKRVLEICCGRGRMALQLARAFPEMELIVNDRYDSAAEAVREAQAKGEVPNAKFQKGDALNLPEFEDESFDVIFGQAALHHLAHDPDAVRKEYARLLKPGGRLIFIFEPLGHNLFVVCVRAIRIARSQLYDESNLHLANLELIAKGYSSCEVQAFNFFGYLTKARILNKLALLMKRFDHFLFMRFPGLRKYAANCNLIFTK